MGKYHNHQILVGVRDEERFSFIAKLWESDDNGMKGIEQYMFHDDKPSGFNLGIMSGSGWPLNHGVIIGEHELPYLQTLAQERPQVRSSLTNCLPHLLTPGLEYGTAPEGSISLSLDLNRRRRSTS